MKKFKLKLAIYVLFIFSIIGCEKEIDPISEQFRVVPAIELSMEVKNRVIEELSEVISLSISNFDVRELLHAEIDKQFDFDYDILYQFIKDRDISTENYGVVSFHDYIINLARDNNIDISNFLKYSESFITLQISSPVYFKLWNYKTQIIPVISLPVDYQEALGIYVNSFHNSVKTQVLETEIHEPILLVREAERVNSKGMMRIDPDGFVLPKELQLLSSRKAYEISSKNLKSRPIESKIIVIVDDEDFESETRKFRDDIRNDKSSYNGLHNTTNTTSSDIGSTTVLKSIASISSPTSFTAYPDDPYEVRMSWAGVQGATKYEIWRQYSSYPNTPLVTLNNYQTSYVNTNLVNGRSYYYSILSVDANGNKSNLTKPFEAKASWRNRYSRDIIEKIYISKDCWSWCCGLFDGKIELQYKVAYYNHKQSQNIAFPSSGTNNFGQKTRDEQRDKWCTYDKSLFSWNIQDHSYNYYFNMIEDDTNGEGVKVKIGTSMKITKEGADKVKIESVPTLGVEFNIASADENFGEIEILYWDSVGEYDLNPKKGRAKIYIKQ